MRKLFGQFEEHNLNRFKKISIFPNTFIIYVKSPIDFFLIGRKIF